MDRRLDAIVKAAPAGKAEEALEAKSKAVNFCMSRVGIAIIAFVLIFILLLVVQPSYIFKKNSLKDINYPLVAIIALVAALFSILIPYLISG